MTIEEMHFEAREMVFAAWAARIYLLLAIICTICLIVIAWKL